MHRARALMLILAVAAWPAVAAAQKVSTDFAANTDFSKYKTYQVMQGKSRPASPLADGKIQAAIDKQLSARGWQRAADGQADVVIVYNVATQQMQTLNTFYDGFGGGPWGWRGGMGSATTTSSTYTEGTLILDMFDAKAKEAFWRGTATGTLSDKPQKNEEKVNKALEKMFKKFPPTKGT